MTIPAGAAELVDYCRQNGIMFLDLRFSQLNGPMRHHTVPLAALSPELLQHGALIEAAEAASERTLLKPLLHSAAIDPFYQHPTLALVATCHDPQSGAIAPSDPRGVLVRAVETLERAGITCRVGAELSFHILDQMSAADAPNAARYIVDSREGAWRRGRDEPDNLGQQPTPRMAEYALPPFDTLHNLRAEMITALAEMNVIASGHRHGRGGAGQAVLVFDPREPLALADTLALTKYVARNVAARHGKLVTFMPQPILGDAGNGLVLRFELTRAGRPLIATNPKGELTSAARSATAGLLSHLGSVTAFACPTTNSYRRLAALLDDELLIETAPSHDTGNTAHQLVLRVADSAADPYLAPAVVLAALLDGLNQKLELELSGGSAAGHAAISGSDIDLPLTLDMALDDLERDHAYLLDSGVLDEATIDRWVNDKLHLEIYRLALRPHPYEFTLYFDV